MDIVTTIGAAAVANDLGISVKELFRRIDDLRIKPIRGEDGWPALRSDDVEKVIVALDSQRSDRHETR